MASLILAVRFLSIVPVPGREAPGPGALGRAAWWFPVVGLTLGGGLALADHLLTRLFPVLLSTLLVLTLWKVATGGVHLDGLADCLDALGGRDADDRIAIMRDSRIGVFGAVGLIVSFLIALVALAGLPPATRARTLVLAPVVGRLSPLLVGRWFGPASRRQGSGADFLRGLSPWAGPLHLGLAAALGALLFGLVGWIAVAVALAVVLAWSSFFAGRLGGLTGDVLGAGVELGELGVLLTVAALAHHALIQFG